MKKYYITSDVHSAYTPLMNALTEAGFDQNNCDHKIIICGDLFDRMDETVKCFEFVKELQTQDRLIYIKGNHEDLLFDCVEEISMGRIPGAHHFHNGTVATICQFCGENEWIIYDPTWRNKILEVMQPVLDFIDENCVDCCVIGDYVFVHGWWPCFEHVNSLSDADESDWNEARWLNGMDMWTNPANRIPGKTIVCGHWHCNWAHSRLHNKCSEWGEDVIFDPFIDDGIIAIDACTAYSGKCNVVVIDL